MSLPSELVSAISQLDGDTSAAELARAVEELSSEYRRKERRRPRLDKAHRAAYLRVRVPATYAVIARVLREAKLRIPELRVESLLDLGAGPGTATWSTAEAFPDLMRVTCLEDSAEWIEIGKRLSANSGNGAIRSADWRQGSVAGGLPSESFDLVMLSYVVNEIATGDRTGIARAAWERTKKLLLIVEPGTPEGFANIRNIRQELVRAGAFIAAPCPHANDCPIGIGDWCHFSERLERTSEHRNAKRGELGYEDEKYSYVILSRESVALPAARILRHPRRHSGHVEFELCTPEGLKQETIARRHGERYKAAKKIKWGETL